MNGTIGAWSLDHANQPVPHARLCPNLIQQLREAFFRKHKATIRRLGQQEFARLADEKQDLPTAERTRVDELLHNLHTRGY